MTAGNIYFFSFSSGTGASKHVWWKLFFQIAYKKGREIYNFVIFRPFLLSPAWNRILTYMECMQLLNDIKQLSKFGFFLFSIFTKDHLKLHNSQFFYLRVFTIINSFRQCATFSMKGFQR